MVLCLLRFLVIPSAHLGRLAVDRKPEAKANAFTGETPGTESASALAICAASMGFFVAYSTPPETD